MIVAVEYLTGWPLAQATPRIDGEALVAFVLREIIAPFGCPARLLSDRGPAFISQLYAYVVRLLGIERNLASKYHPHTNGKCERLNQTLMRSLEKHAHDNPARWDDQVPLVLLSFRVNSGPNGMSPYELLYGTKPRLPVDLLANAEAPVRSSPRLRRLGLDQTSLARLCLPPISFASTQPRFRPGDQVMCLRTLALRRRAGLGKVPKFTELFAGPYTEVRCEVPRLYRLQNAEGNHSRNPVHENRLVGYRARSPRAAGGAREGVSAGVRRSVQPTSDQLATL